MKLSTDFLELLLKIGLAVRLKWSGLVIVVYAVEELYLFYEVLALFLDFFQL